MNKKAEKYTWKIGSTLPTLDEHSQIKHKIISDYLKRYIEVVMANHAMERLSITIVDGFAGGGKYKDILENTIVDGSPFIALKAIKEAEVYINSQSRKPRYIDAQYHFIEQKKSHFEFLDNETKHSEFSHLYKSTAFLHNCKFEVAAKNIIEKIKLKNPRKQRAIFILDQYSYKDVPFSVVSKIFSELSNGEVILTFNFDAAQSYISDNPKNRKALSNIQLEQYISWDRLKQLKEAGKWHSAIQEQLANAIFKASGAKHITLFFLHPQKGRSYWLVHLSNVYRARDVMMDIHWKYANNQPYFTHHLGTGIFALGYKAQQTPGQNDLDLCYEKTLNEETEQLCIMELSKQLPEHIYKKGKVLFSDITESFGSLTIGSESHIKSALQTAMDNKEVIIHTGEGGVRRSSTQISGSDIIEYKQRCFTFGN